MGDLDLKMKENRNGVERVISTIKKYSAKSLIFGLIGFLKKDAYGIDFDVKRLDYFFDFLFAIPICDRGSEIVYGGISDKHIVANPGKSSEVAELYSLIIRLIDLSDEVKQLLFSNERATLIRSREKFAIRGNDQREHLKDFSIKLFSDFNDQFIDAVGFTIDDVWRFIEDPIFVPYNVAPTFFEYSKLSNKNRCIVDYFSAEPGENSSFLEGKYAGCPGVNSILPRKFIMKVGDGCMLVGMRHLIDNLKDIFQSIIMGNNMELKGDGSSSVLYSDHKGSVLEKVGMDVIRDIFQSGKVYSNVRYTHNGQEYEADGLVIWNSMVVVVEMKFRLEHRSLDVLRVERDAKNAIYRAYRQGERFIDCLRSEDVVTVSSGGKDIGINDLDIKDVFIVNITSDSFGSLASSYIMPDNVGLINSNYNFLSIYIGDLMILRDTEVDPLFFLSYIKRKKVFHEHRSISPDEIDMYMAFCDNERIKFMKYEDGQKMSKLETDPSFELYARYQNGVSRVVEPKRNDDICDLIESLADNDSIDDSLLIVMMLFIVDDCHWSGLFSKIKTKKAAIEGLRVPVHHAYLFFCMNVEDREANNEYLLGSGYLSEDIDSLYVVYLTYENSVSGVIIEDAMVLYKD